MRLVLALAAAAAALSGGSALACSCVPQRSAAEQLAGADVVFKGRVVGAQSTNARHARTRFRVVEVLKGPKPRTLDVEHAIDSAACGMRFRPGTTVWVFADRAQDGRLRTGSCSWPAFPEAEYRRAARGEPVPTRPPVF